MNARFFKGILISLCLMRAPLATNLAENGQGNDEPTPKGEETKTAKKRKPKKAKRNDADASVQSEAEDNERRKIIRRYMFYLGIIVIEAILLTIGVLVGIGYVGVLLSRK
uniref:Transmembrane protein n=1 Tax=Bursaphelenchus xylophilus TaxID=6326 RepID=A0A1I7RTW5_BURXY